MAKYLQDNFGGYEITPRPPAQEFHFLEAKTNTLISETKNDGLKINLNKLMEMEKEDISIYYPGRNNQREKFYIFPKAKLYVKIDETYC